MFQRLQSGLQVPATASTRHCIAATRTAAGPGTACLGHAGCWYLYMQLRNFSSQSAYPSPWVPSLLSHFLACHLSSTPDSRSDRAHRAPVGLEYKYYSSTENVKIRHQKPFASQAAGAPFYSELLLVPACSNLLLPSLPCRPYITSCIRAVYILFRISSPYISTPAQIVWRPATFLAWLVLNP